MRLRDGRIVVLFARRTRPAGIGLFVSEDDGATWSAEAIVRDDGSGGDLGYPVATQLDDGRIFTAYYFMEDDGNNFGGDALHRWQLLPPGIVSGFVTVHAVRWFDPQAAQDHFWCGCATSRRTFPIDCHRTPVHDDDGWFCELDGMFDGIRS